MIKPEQMFAGPPDSAEIRQQVLLAAVLRHLLQHLAIADHRIEGRAELVAHVRQEGALGAIGFLGGVFGAHQFALHALQLGHILRQPDVPFQYARTVAHFRGREQHGNQSAGFGAISTLYGAAPRGGFALQNHLSGRPADQIFLSV